MKFDFLLDFMFFYQMFMIRFCSTMLSVTDWAEKECEKYINIKVTNPETVQQRFGKSYVTFEIISTDAENNSCSVRHRFSEFQQLYDAFVARYGSSGLDIYNWGDYVYSDRNVDPFYAP